MKIKEAIILAGGKGTRLQPAIPGMQKCLAPVGNKAFIDFVIEHLVQQGISRFIFALGFEAQAVQAYVVKAWPQLEKIFSIEHHPLGTGGAILQAAAFAKEQSILVVNGDTLFRCELSSIDIAIAETMLFLKPMNHYNRYGSVVIDGNNIVAGFAEKKATDFGLINTGTYILNLHPLLQHPWPSAFSFEKDYLEKNAGSGKLSGVVQDNYFIDIGIPEDYEKAKQELAINHA